MVEIYFYVLQAEALQAIYKEYTFDEFLDFSNTPNSKMSVAWDDLGRAVWKWGIEGQVTTMASFAYDPSYTFLVQYKHSNFDSWSHMITIRKHGMILPPALNASFPCCSPQIIPSDHHFGIRSIQFGSLTLSLPKGVKGLNCLKEISKAKLYITLLTEDHTCTFLCGLLLRIWCYMYIKTMSPSW